MSSIEKLPPAENIYPRLIANFAMMRVVVPTADQGPTQDVDEAILDRSMPADVLRDGESMYAHIEHVWDEQHEPVYVQTQRESDEAEPLARSLSVLELLKERLGGNWLHVTIEPVFDEDTLQPTGWRIWPRDASNEVD